jgi:ribokinase
MGGVVVIGSFNVDHVWQCEALPRPGETLGGRYRSGPGGKGFNQAVAARRAGAETTFVCALGADAGANLARELADVDGIALRALASDAPTGTAGIYVDSKGRNSIVIGAGANGALDRAFVEAQRDAIAGAAVVLAQLETPLDAVDAALRLARTAGVRTLLNPAPANAIPSRGTLALADVLTPNETEFAALLREHTAHAHSADAVPGLDDDALHACCRALLPDGTVVVTLGAAGALVSHPRADTHGDGAANYRVPALAARTIDTTGAGDAFSGALAASIAQRREAAFAQHVAFATEYAARSTEAEGAAVAMPRMTPLR